MTEQKRQQYCAKFAEITVIVIPAPDEQGFSKKPYILHAPNDYSSFRSLLGDSCFDVVKIANFTRDKVLDAYVDDDGKLKGLTANNVFNCFALDVLGFKPNYTLDGDVILALSNLDGENIDFIDYEAEFILLLLLDCHKKVQGVPLPASKPEMTVLTFN